jgi:hypothetical protein
MRGADTVGDHDRRVTHTLRTTSDEDNAIRARMMRNMMDEAAVERRRGGERGTRAGRGGGFSDLEEEGEEGEERGFDESGADEEEEYEEEDVEGDNDEFKLFSTLRGALSGDRGKSGGLNRGLFGSSGEGFMGNNNEAVARVQVKESLNTWHAAFEQANAELLLVGLSQSGHQSSQHDLHQELEMLYNGGANSGAATGPTNGRRTRRNHPGSGSDTEGERSDDEAEGQTTQDDEVKISNATLLGNTVSCLKKSNIELTNPDFIFQEELKQLRSLVDELDETAWMFSTKLF